MGPVIRDFMCTMGLRCDLTLNGYELAPTSSIVVLSSGACGDADAVQPSGILIGKLKQTRTKPRRKIERSLGLSSFIFTENN